MVRAAGLEPAHHTAMEPKSIESTNSTTPACCRIDRHYQYISKFLFRQSLPEEKKGDIMAY